MLAPTGGTMHHLYKRSIGILAGMLLMPLLAGAQTPETYKIRIAPVPRDVAMQKTVAGGGSATATLSGSKLTISGTFDGLPSSATSSKVHRSLTTGVRGSPFLDLT